MKRFDPKSKIGVNAIEKIFLEDFGWIPRVIFDSDVGIDMVVEIVADNNPTGKLIGVQIKTGVSYFKEKKQSGYVFRDSKIHFKYWLNHMLPVYWLCIILPTN